MSNTSSPSRFSILYISFHSKYKYSLGICLNTRELVTMSTDSLLIGKEIPSYGRNSLVFTYAEKREAMDRFMSTPIAIALRRFSCFVILPYPQPTSRTVLFAKYIPNDSATDKKSFATADKSNSSFKPHTSLLLASTLLFPSHSNHVFWICFNLDMSEIFFAEFPDGLNPIPSQFGGQVKRNQLGSAKSTLDRGLDG